MEKTSKAPNPDRVYAVIASILQRRYDVKIEYTVSPKFEGGNYERDHC